MEIYTKNILKWTDKNQIVRAPDSRHEKKDLQSLSPSTNLPMNIPAEIETMKSGRLMAHLAHKSIRKQIVYTRNVNQITSFGSQQ